MSVESSTGDAGGVGRLGCGRTHQHRERTSARGRGAARGGLGRLQGRRLQQPEARERDLRLTCKCINTVISDRDNCLDCVYHRRSWWNGWAGGEGGLPRGPRGRRDGKPTPGHGLQARVRGRVGVGVDGRGAGDKRDCGSHGFPQPTMARRASWEWHRICVSAHRVHRSATRRATCTPRKADEHPFARRLLGVIGGCVGPSRCA